MKVTPNILAILALASAPTFAKPVVSAPMDDLCVRAIQGALDSLSGGLYADNNGKVYIDPADLAAFPIKNVKTLASSCIGPADCDAQNPDAFTWSANVGNAGELHGTVVVSYHRGNCNVQKLTLKSN